MIDNLSIATNTHTSACQLWDMFLNETHNNIPFLKHYIFCNSKTIESHFVAEENLILYDDQEPFWKQYCDSLKQIEDDFILTLYEDLIVYEKLDEHFIYNKMKWLEDSNFSFVRMIKSGINKDIHIEDDLYEVSNEEKYFFSMQPTIWKRKDLIEALEHSQIKTIWEEVSVANSLNALNMSGVYIYNDENKIGRHYESSTFPVLEVISHSSFNTRTYGSLLINLLNKYGVEA